MALAEGELAKGNPWPFVARYIEALRNLQGSRWLGLRTKVGVKEEQFGLDQSSFCKRAGK